MAIEISPEPNQKTNFLANGIYYFCLLIFCLAISGSAILFYLNKRASKKIETLNVQVAQLRSSEAEKRFRQDKKRIEDFGALLRRHRAPSVFLDSAKGPFSQTNKKLAGLIHPQVQLVSLSVDLERSEVNISGVTKNLVTLEQQLMIFKQEPLVKETSLSNFSATKEGKLNFEASLVFDPSVFISAK